MDKLDMINFELDMIRLCLMLNPENQKLSSDELDKLVTQEYKDSRD